MSDDIKTTLKERGDRYGGFKCNATITRKIKDLCNQVRLESDFADQWTPEMEEGLDMIIHKIARAVCGDPSYDDTWRDIAGYAKLVEDSINGKDQ